MLRTSCASGDISVGGISQVLAPDEVLSAVDVAPVPVSAHHSIDEVVVIGRRRVIAVEITGLDIVGGRSDGSSSEQSCEGSEESEELHVIDAAQRCEQKSVQRSALGSKIRVR